MNHWPIFAEFCQQELATGGPDPQIRTLAQLSADATLESRVWLIGCYGAHHCVPSAYLIHKEFSTDDVLSRPKYFKKWLEEHWKELPVRPEMRNHRMLDKRHKCLMDFARFAQWYRRSKYNDYDHAWTDTQIRVKYFGRYMAIKVLEMLYRFGDSPQLESIDMRAKGGWSPRICLSLLWEDYPEIADRKDNTPDTLRRVEHLFRRTKARLRDKWAIEVSCFQLQVLLCEYKEALAGGYYPGASLDEELEYIAQSGHRCTEVLKARRAAFKERYLGELRGWNGVRPELFQPFKVKRDER